MDVYYGLSKVPAFDKSVLTLGTYDGLHLGHQAVIGHVVHLGRERGMQSVLITFDTHPKNVLPAIGKAARPKLILPLEGKLEILESMGLDAVLVLNFDRKFSETPALDFLSNYMVAAFNPSTIVIGYDNRFGHNRQGNAEFLRMHMDEFHYSVVEMTEVSSQTAGPLSSHRIRQLLNDGKCEQANAILGRVYSIRAQVVPGDGRGSKLGYPTANLEPKEAEQLVPKIGVYVVSVLLENQILTGMANIGHRPTFGGGDLLLEVHLFEYDYQELYGREVTVEFYHRLRDELKFPGPQALKEQLDNDKEESLAWHNKHQEGIERNALVN